MVNMLGVPRVNVTGVPSKNVISFEHRIGFGGPKKMGATLRLIDPDNSIERNLLANTTKEQISSFAKYRPTGGGDGNPEDARDKSYVSQISGGGGGLGGGGQTAIDLNISYSVPGGGSSGSQKFIIANGRVIHKDGVKEVELDLVYVPFNMDMEEMDKVLTGSGQTGELTVAGKSGVINIGSDAKSVDHHKYISQAYKNFAIAAYGYKKTVALIPDIGNALNAKIQDATDGIQKCHPEADPKAIARMVLDQVYSSLGLDLCEIDNEQMDIKSAYTIASQAITAFQEREEFTDPDEAVSAYLAKSQVFIKMEHKTPTDKRLGGLQAHMADVLGNIGRGGLDDYTVQFDVMAGSDGTFYVGDKGMLATVRGAASQGSKFGGQDSSYIGKEASTGSTPYFKLNMGDSSNVIDLVYEQQNWFQNLMAVSYTKGLSFVATNQKAGKTRSDTNATGGNNMAEAQEAQSGGAKVGSGVVTEAVVKAAGGGGATLVLDPGAGETKGENAAAGVIAPLVAKFNRLRITTLPQFSTSKIGDIGKSVSVQGNNVAFAGISGGGGTPQYAGSYVILGFKHTIDPTGAKSEFLLQSTF